ncbi:unnamed protein product [Heligmosomoides polygyrus]|uniref:Lzipper-MIP1 domain-containing protein n=1 Tax=Heligmosomoides polygyrus TaxID=6339 RepID=A0A183G9S1_HELPZ|nr:unnamed protein product [Heligmosomoides polygyrus]
MESKLMSANVQIGIDVHTSPLKELTETVASLQKTLQEGIASNKEQMEKAEVKGDGSSGASGLIGMQSCSVENLKEPTNKGSVTENPRSRRADTDVNDCSVTNHSEGDIEKDLLDLDYEGENGVESAVAQDKDTRDVGLTRGMIWCSFKGMRCIDSKA